MLLKLTMMKANPMLLHLG